MTTIKIKKTQRTPQTQQMDDDKLAQLMMLHNDNRIDYNERIWATINFSQAIFSAVIAATISIFYEVNKDLINCISLRESVCKALPFRFQIPVIFLLIVGLFSLFFSLFNVNRESKHLLKEEGQCIKIAHYLNLDKQIPENKKWLRDEDFIFLEEWRSYRNKATKDSEEKGTLIKWVGGNMTGGFRLYFSIFVCIEILFTIFLTILLFYLFNAPSVEFVHTIFHFILRLL